MLFDITQYNQYILFFTFILFTGAGMYLFRSKYISIIDPLTLHIIWIASHLSFLSGYMYRYGIGILPAFFFINMLLYAYFYKLFLRNNKVVLSPYSPTSDNKSFKPGKIKLIFVLLIFINLYSKSSFFQYVIENPNIATWFLYRFIDMQGRDPLLRILSGSSSVFLIFYAFFLFTVIRKWRYFVVISYAMIVLLDVFAGGRSILVSIIFNFGLGFFYFREYFKISEINRFTKKGLIFSGAALVAAIVVTSFYDSNYSISDGLSIVTNRFLAAGDGLEYYMNYDGLHKIKTGLEQYVYSIFGIYLKRFTGVNYKNIGLQLSELVLGDLEFTQGSNYTFLLQIMVIGYQFFLIYIPVIAYCTAKLRTIKFNSQMLFPLSFFLSATSFLLPEDIEYWFLTTVSGLLLFYVLIYPINKFSFTKPKRVQ